MKKINKKIISIPPYISTSWGDVSALHVKEKKLFVTLKNGEIIVIPNLPREMLDTIFAAHAEYLEERSDEKRGNKIDPFTMFQNLENQPNIPLKFNIGAFDQFGAMMQHNPDQKDAPDLPREILDKVSAISKIIVPEDQSRIPKPEPHCNCVHCQIARAIQKALGIEDIFTKNMESDEEPVSNDDLKFQQWDIQQTDEKLYVVVNRLDSQEKYNVFLGNPVGCTCGKRGCEHILAVLKS